MAVMPVAVKLVNHRPAGVIAVIVDAGNIQDGIETEIGFGESTDVGDAFGVVEGDREFVTELDGCRHEITELAFQFCRRLKCAHCELKIAPIRPAAWFRKPRPWSWLSKRAAR